MSCYNREQIEMLLKKAAHYNNQAKLVPCWCFYRNKDEDYFNEILQSDGLMRTRLKHNIGDPRCPTNDRLYAISFYTKVSSDPIPEFSPYGMVRLLVDPTQLLTEDCNLYFSDFYCVGAHYVQLIIVPRSQVTSLPVLNELVELDITSNSFLRLTDDGVVVTSCQDIRVEVFFTGHINIKEMKNIHKAVIKPCNIFFKVDANLSCLRKSPECPVCNI